MMKSVHMWWLHIFKADLCFLTYSTKIHKCNARSYTNSKAAFINTTHVTENEDNIVIPSITYRTNENFTNGKSTTKLDHVQYTSKTLPFHMCMRISNIGDIIQINVWEQLHSNVEIMNTFNSDIMPFLQTRLDKYK